MGFVASLAAEYLQLVHHPDFSIHHRHTDSLHKDFEQILLKSKYSNLLFAGHWRLIRRQVMTCAPIWPPWGHVETINTNLHENLETREAWLFSFWNDYCKKEKNLQQTDWGEIHRDKLFGPAEFKRSLACLSRSRVLSHFQIAKCFYLNTISTWTVFWKC